MYIFYVLFRLAVETDRNRQAIDDINTANRTVLQKDRELTDLRLAMQKPIQDLEVMTKEYDALLREKETMKRRYKKVAGKVILSGKHCKLTYSIWCCFEVVRACSIERIHEHCWQQVTK